MLDDLKLIHAKDPEDAFGQAEKQAQALLQVLPVQGSLAFSNVYNVVFAGNADALAAAELLAVWPKLGEPFEIIPGYELPQYVDHETLVILADQSDGNERIMTLLASAEERKAQIAVISSDNSLLLQAAAKGYPRIVIPKVNKKNSYATLQIYRSILDILVLAKLLPQTITDELTLALSSTSEAAVAWRPDVPTTRNSAKQLALELMGKSVVIYTGPQLYPVARYWKAALNMRAKQLAWTGRYLDMICSDLAGWSGQPIAKPYAVIALRSHLEHPQIQKSFELSARLLSGKRPEAQTVEVGGTTIFQQLLWMIAFSDFVTIYLALLHGLNPVEDGLVEKYKKELEL